MTKRDIRIFLDSPVIISGLFSEAGASRIILDILSLGLPHLTAVTGRCNIMEIERNLARRMTGAVPIYEKYIQKLNLKAVPLPTPAELQRFAGQSESKNSPVSASVISSQPNFFVTRSKKDYDLEALAPVRVVSPDEFLRLFVPEIISAVQSV